jgi:hypothetical protein
MSKEAKPTGRYRDAQRSGHLAADRSATPPGRYEATFDTDGSGHWKVKLPSDCTFEDLAALAPVIDAGRAFIDPTVHDAA